MFAGLAVLQGIHGADVKSSQREISAA